MKLKRLMYVAVSATMAIGTFFIGSSNKVLAKANVGGDKLQQQEQQALVLVAPAAQGYLLATHGSHGSHASHASHVSSSFA